MTEITPALLAEFKHRVPEGALIPGNLPVVRIGKTTGVSVWLDGLDCDGRAPHGPDPIATYWTREPFRPPLPTGLGAVLKDVTTTWNTTIPILVRADHLTDEDCRWFMATIPGAVDDRWLRDENLATWTEVSKGVELP